LILGFLYYLDFWVLRFDFLKMRNELMLDQELLKILACPACQGDLVEENEKLICQKCGLKYPVKDGIPILLIDEAEK